MRLLVIHLTDLHVKRTIEYLREKVESIKNIVLNFESVENVLFLFTGDIAFSGLKEQYYVAKTLVESLRNLIDSAALDLGRNLIVRFVFCPGNHDRRMLDDMSAKYLEGINSENYFEKVQENKLLNSNYRGFLTEVAPSETINDVLESYTIDFHGHKCKVYSLNNALLSTFCKNKKQAYDENKGKIFIPREYLKINRANAELCILAMHIPMEFYCEETRKELEEKCATDIDFIFSGHTHEQRSSIVNHGNSRVLEFVSTALYAGQASGFGCYEIDENEVYCYSYLFSSGDEIYEPISGREDTISFLPKESTVFNQEIEECFLNETQIINLDSRFAFPADKLFVFPLLTTPHYSSRHLNIQTIQELDERLLQCPVISVSGDHYSGKTTFANYLFHHYIVEGFVPVLIDGSSIRKKAWTAIESGLKTIYSSRNITKSFRNTPKEKRILIIDNFERATDETLAECLEYFCGVVYTCSDGNSMVRILGDGVGIKVAKYTIEPFFYDKRTKFLGNIYNCMAEKIPSIKENYSRDAFINVFEQTLFKMDSATSYGAHEIAILAVQILTKIDIYQNASARSLFHYSLKEKIQTGLLENHYQNCDLVIAERMIADLAYTMYLGRKNTFTKSDFDIVLRQEDLVYGTRPVKTSEPFINMLVKQSVFKRSGDDYAFYDRASFAYFVGKRAIEAYHYDGNRTMLDKIIARGIYSPLNFQILLSIATVYEYGGIPSYFVNDLFPLVNAAPVVDENLLDEFSNLLSNGRKKLMNITAKERDEYSSRRAKAENKSRNEYLKNIDNYFYEEKVEEGIKTIIEWGNRIQIVSVLLNSFATSLKKDDKDKLIQMAIRLPSITLQAVFDMFTVSLKDLFLGAQSIVENEEDSQAEFNEVVDYLISFINALVLTYYDVGCRPLNNPIITRDISKLLCKHDYINNRIQELMLFSFSKWQDEFVKEATKSIKSKDAYISRCARLIGRRFCLENLDLVMEKYPDFANLVSGGKNSLLISEKTRKYGVKKKK